MKFTKDFLKILKYFQIINPNMYFVKGLEQTTILKTSGGSSLLFVRAKTDMNIEENFAVSNLNKLITTLSLFDDYNLVVDGADLVISSDTTVVRFALTHIDYCVYEKNPNKFKRNPDGIKCNIVEATLEKIMKFSGMIKANNLSFIGEDGDFLVKIKSNNDEMVIKIGETDQTFTATIDMKNFLVPESDYDIVVIRKGAVYLRNDNLEFYIPCDKNASNLE